MFPLPHNEAGQKRTKDINKSRCHLHRCHLWDGTERKLCFASNDEDVVLASSITLGPSLGEKVDAADWDHTKVTKPMDDTAAMVL